MVPCRCVAAGEFPAVGFGLTTAERNTTIVPAPGIPPTWAEPLERR